MTTYEQNRDAGGGWLVFSGGELEGKRPDSMCASCRARKRGRRGGSGLPAGTLCFHCYRATLDRERALKAASQLDTASEARFQAVLPFEPVNRPRLAMLRTERVAVRAARQRGSEQFADRQHQAQIAARRALRLLASGPSLPRPAQMPQVPMPVRARSERERLMLAAIHAAELQLPESWLPFVVSW